MWFWPSDSASRPRLDCGDISIFCLFLFLCVCLCSLASHCDCASFCDKNPLLIPVCLFVCLSGQQWHLCQLGKPLLTGIPGQRSCSCLYVLFVVYWAPWWKNTNTRIYLVGVWLCVVSWARPGRRTQIYLVGVSLVCSVLLSLMKTKVNKTRNHQPRMGGLKLSVKCHLVETLLCLDALLSTLLKIHQSIHSPTWNLSNLLHWLPWVTVWSDYTC